MPSVRYLIVGGGLTADGACKGIREVDADGPIAVVGAEPHPPYLRPPLSKGLWKGDGEQTIWRGTGDLGVDLVLSRRIVSLDPGSRSATDDRGETYGYERFRDDARAAGVVRGVPGDVGKRGWYGGAFARGRTVLRSRGIEPRGDSACRLSAHAGRADQKGSRHLRRQ